MKGNNLIIRQVSREAEAWKKILGFLQQENILQKNKLVVILKTDHKKDEDLLEIAEQYQYQFLQQDEALRLMWNDIAELEKLMEGNNCDNIQRKKLSQRWKKFRKEIESLEINFDKLNSGFNNFLEVFPGQD